MSSSQGVVEGRKSNNPRRSVSVATANSASESVVGHDESENSLSTTPTQSQHKHTPNQAQLRDASVNTWRNSGESAGQNTSQSSDSQGNTLGRNQPAPRPALNATPRSASARYPSVQGSLNAGTTPRSAARSTSYAPSDLESGSALSASEYDSDDGSILASNANRSMQDSGAQSLHAAQRSSSTTTTARGRGDTVRAVSSKAGVSSSMSRATGASQSTNRGGSRRTSVADKGRRSSVARGGGRSDDEDGRFGPLDDEDDEVQPYDRGEELVRRRAKARKKLEKQKQKAAEQGRTRQQQQQTPSSPRIRSGSIAAIGGGLRSPQPEGGAATREGRPMHISIPTPGSEISSGLLSPGTAPSSAAPPTASPGGSRHTSGASGHQAYPSPHSHIMRSGLPATSPDVHSARRSSANFSVSTTRAPTTGAPARDVFSDSNRAQSEVGAGSIAGSVVEGSSEDGDIGQAEEDDHEEGRDTLGGLVKERDTQVQAVRNSTGVDVQEASPEDGDSGDLDDDANGDDDGDSSGGDVEYTLKDRQDAINIEHPFGLPIWKPALYKKSRTVTRNAEDALHSMPSAAAERHLLPGNIIWTVFFGSWLSVLCILLSFVLAAVPLGGRRYARVLWELGCYLIWPFGKYVEVDVGPNSGERGTIFGDDDQDATNGEEGDATFENAFTPVAARFPHDHEHHTVPFNSRAGPRSASSRSFADEQSTLKQRPDLQQHQDCTGSSSSNEASSSRQGVEDVATATRANFTEAATETSPLKGKRRASGTAQSADYGAMGDAGLDSGSEVKDERERIVEERRLYEYVHDADGNDIGRSRRLGGTIAYGIFFWIALAPVLGLVCLSLWGVVFTIPMAKLTWVLLKNLATQPLALHFRSAPGIALAAGLNDDDAQSSSAGSEQLQNGFLKPLQPGQFAPRRRVVRKEGGALEPVRRSKILLCTYRAMGLQYYKYTVGGVNILFINTLPFVILTILDFFFVEDYVHRHHIETGFLAFISSQGALFVLALGSVLPLSYFIGMAVASISAQSSIGMGAVINATFGSIVEIILYAIALTQDKARLVEGSLVGSILAGVLLMPGLSMCSGATRRKEQRFNARSAGVTSTMLIMAIIGILTPTLFYQIYGTFQLTCNGCPVGAPPGDTWTCKQCFYEHVPPASDPFYQRDVKGLMYTCTVVLVLSYGIGLWFSLRTHASQIWQNPNPVPAVGATPVHQHAGAVHTGAGSNAISIPSAQRASIYKRILQPVGQLLPTHGQQSAYPASAPAHGQQHRPHSQAHSQGTGTARSSRGGAPEGGALPPLQLPESASLTSDDYARAVALTTSAFMQEDERQKQLQQQSRSSSGHAPANVVHHANQAIPRSAVGPAQPRHHSVHDATHDADDAEGGHGGHDAPSWTRNQSMFVLLSCTVLYAIIAEILVDAVDVVLDGAGIDIKLLGITLFALVPNTTEFLNAMSFAMNGNIALSMEIGSAYALQVCLIQIPAMVVFSAWWNRSGEADEQQIFSLIFPRWDVIAIIFSIFLLTYTYTEARSNYYRGSILILSYVVLVSGFVFAPSTGDTEDPGEDLPGPGTLLTNTVHLAAQAVGTHMGPAATLKAWIGSLWTR
ncbi:Ca2 /H antiporter VCX1 and related proteins [Ceraceosorus bombacis]|uniref:Ca2 /H antiporter VCX1 and related proteins n=1 Tax=Ceraceosorus bombacis TaxID=401625 RepID=A0A0P1BR54_9BASI|nr:Ca2 /H antiporter VCX1 and related proteins [Ceraceosorus bombacis]